MTLLTLSFPGFSAALMMAISPMTGPCEGRVVQICTGAGEIRHHFLWDEENPIAPSDKTAKACHACPADQRRLKRTKNCAH